MLKIENVEVTGWEHAIRGMRNPMNSWHLSDTTVCVVDDSNECERCDAFRHNDRKYSFCTQSFKIGPNDHKLMMSLAKGGPVHAKYRRMVNVYLDITAPLYWWKEFDTYKVGTVANSCSTMHKIHAKEFTLDDFSCEHLMCIAIDRGDEDDVPVVDISPYHDGTVFLTPAGLMNCQIEMLNKCREKYLEAKTKPMKDESKRAGLMKQYWWQMIQLLPTSYNQKRTVMLNYEVLHNIYHPRRHHKLDEWHTFCDWIESLPYSEIIIGEKSTEAAE